MRNVTVVGLLAAVVAFAASLTSISSASDRAGEACALKWRVVMSIPNAELTGVAAVSSSDVWVVGFKDTSSGRSPLVRHWDGRRWREVSTPVRRGFLADIAVVSARDIWAVGAADGLEPVPLALHWDGARWRAVSTPARPDAWFEAAAASAVNQVWAVGSWRPIVDEEYLFIFGRWNGNAWRMINRPSGDLGYAMLSGVASVSGNDVWAVGYEGIHGSEQVIEHWDGRKWRSVPTPRYKFPPDADDRITHSLADVAAVSPSEVWAVGQMGNGPLIQGRPTMDGRSEPASRRLVECYRGRISARHLGRWQACLRDARGALGRPQLDGRADAEYSSRVGRRLGCERNRRMGRRRRAGRRVTERADRTLRLPVMGALDRSARSQAIGVSLGKRRRSDTGRP